MKIRIALLLFLTAFSTIAHAAKPLEIPFTLQKPARVSINIYDAKGQIVRELLHGGARKAGANKELWDGRDNAGKVLPAGEYSWKLLGVPGFGAEYITNPGASFAVDPKGNWWAQSPGSHYGVNAIAVDESGAYISAFTENIETCILKQSLDGTKRLWTVTTPHVWESPSALALGGKKLWALVNGKIFSYDATTGAKDEKKLEVGIEGNSPTDMAATDTGLILSYPAAGLVRWIDFEGKETRSVKVANASTVDFAPDGSVYVLSGKSLLKIAAGSTLATPLVENLSAPHRAAVNATNGDIYVVESGELNQVKRFSRDGKLLNTYGKKGGRVDGLYQPQRASFRGTQDIVAEKNGNFWVAEGTAAPRRVAKLAVDGTFRGEWVGGQMWAPCLVPEPDNPRFAWVLSQGGEMMRVEVDAAKKNWKIHSTYRYSGLANGLIPASRVDTTFEARVHNSQLYLACVKITPYVLRVDRTNWKLMPASALCEMVPHYIKDYPQWVKDALGQNNSMRWTDANGDGLALDKAGKPQKGELFFYPDQWPIGLSYLDHELNLMFYHSGGPIRRVSVTSWNAVGSPVYGNFPATEVVGEIPTRMGGAYDPRWSAYLTADAKGNVWGAFNGDIQGWGAAKDPFIARWNPDKTLAWTVGRSGSTPGSLRALRRIYGIINDCVVASAFSYEWYSEGPTPVYVFDKDGLYAGQIFGKPADATTPTWHYSLGAEGLSGEIRQFGKDVYLYGHWINEGRIWKITGWDGWQRANSKIAVPANFEVPPAMVEAVGPSGNGTGLKGEYWINTYERRFGPNWDGAPTMTRIDPIPATPGGPIPTAGIDYDWGTGWGDKPPFVPPIPGQDWFSVRLSGSLTPRRTGWHMFKQDRALQLTIFVNGEEVEGWRHEAHHRSGRAVWLEAGRAYPFVMEGWRYPSSSLNGISLQWSEPESNSIFTLIPTSQLSPTMPPSTPAAVKTGVKPN